MNQSNDFVITTCKKKTKIIMAVVGMTFMVGLTAVLYLMIQNKKNLGTEKASASASRDYRAYQVWSYPYNPDNPSCIGVQNCLNLSETSGHLWSFTSSKDRIYDLARMKSTVDSISTGLLEYPDLQTPNEIISSKAIFQFGDIEKFIDRTGVYTACIGTSCTDEFTANPKHCKDNSTINFNVTSTSKYSFTNSICGNETVNIKFNFIGMQNQRYSLLVGWYTGAIADQIDVIFNGVKRGSIVSTANSSAVTVINTNLEGNKSHSLTFKGIRGDGVGLDFIALVPVNYYDTFAIGDDVPTLQFEEFTTANTEWIIGKDEKSSTHKPCYGSICNDEFMGGHCRDVADDKVYTTDVQSKFPNSICGVVNGVKKKVSITTQIPQGRYSFIVGWYTSSIADKVNVTLDGVQVGVIETRANSADWSIITLDQKSSVNDHIIQFEGIEGDGFGLDFIALTRLNLMGEHKGFHMFTESGVNTNNNFANNIFYPIAEYVHSKGLKFSVEPFAYPVKWNSMKTGYEIDTTKLDSYLNTFISPALGDKKVDVVAISLDPLAYDYGMSFKTNLMDSVITIAKAIKRINPSVKVSFDQGNLYRHYCVNLGGACDFTLLSRFEVNKSYFDYFFAYGYDFIWKSSGQNAALQNYYVAPMYVDYKSIFASRNLSPMCYQLNPTEGNNDSNKNYHFELKVDRTINALNSLYQRYPSNHGLPCIQISGMNWQKTGTESPTFFLKDNALGMF